MYLIYKILKEIRYIMRSKSMKRLITLALLIVLLSMLCSRVFAFEVVDENGYTLTFGDISNLDTASNINDYYVVAFDIRSTNEAIVYFFPKEIFSNSIFAYDQTDSSSNIYYYTVTYLPNTPVTYYQAYYKKSGGNYVYSYYLTRSYSTDMNGLINYYNSSPGGHTLIYSNVDMTTLFLANLQDFSVTLSTEEETEGPLYLYTNYFDINYRSNFGVSVVLYPNTAESLNIDLYNNIELNPDNASRYRYFFEVPENGVYDIVFSITYNDYFNTKVIRKTVSNIVTQQGGETGGNEGRWRNRGRRQRGRFWQFFRRFYPRF